ncbi:MAG: hypothetical protein ACSLE4_00605 [Methyloceanibacter sp.]|uniref:hypothetical protein n=1 Tax=Methyloceanibacter sp. TaxID=1965321 RepID=UPI003EDFE758
MIAIDPLDQQFSDLLARMTREQKQFLCDRFHDFASGLAHIRPDACPTSSWLP